ncbi:hypothetical protein B0O99DRAFT_606746 [Bisporella sp. PMI_857]|nr:hypothetical protein B0O99DRAFT_606746 [Bisporella sp. PMI_857]
MAPAYKNVVWLAPFNLSNADELATELIFRTQPLSKCHLRRSLIPALRNDHEARVYIAQTGSCGSHVHYLQAMRNGDLGSRDKSQG